MPARTPPRPATSTGGFNRRQKQFLRGGPARDDATRPKTEKIITYFERPSFAFFWMLGMLLLVAAVYAGLHVMTGCSCDQRDATMRDAVIVSNDGRFALSYRDGVLEHNFAKARINEMKQHLDEMRLQLLPVVLAQRRQVLTPAVDFAHRALADRAQPGILGLDPQRVEDSDLQLTIIPATIEWLDAQADRLAPENKAYLPTIVARLRDQHAREEIARTAFKADVSRLESALSFCWLWVDGCGWIGEVVFWSLFGVLANAIIALITKSRAGQYSADEFVLVFPKILLAPLLALVVIAIWATGLSEAQVGYLNLPMFLVFAFCLGFATEQLYTLLRDLAQGIVGRLARLSDTKLEEAARNDPYRFVHPPADASSVPPPKTLAELRQTLTDVAQSQVERGIVTQLTQK
ncbi:MAG TPA: hypothetical protein VHD62_11055 [Opitutaceae bacterium]|nr:hypothetical protein [Opitutaceae bacterium]